MEALPPVCPWRLDIVRAVLRGTHDTQSPLRLLSSEVLKMIVRRWAWPEVLINSARLWEPMVLVNVLIAELLEANPGTVTEAQLREQLDLNPDGSIDGWDLSDCGLRALPELFGAVCTTGGLCTGGLYLYNNQLSSLPDSFGSITVGGDLLLYGNQLGSLPDSFGSITVGGHLYLDSNELDSLPDSFGSIAVGGSLWLRNNRLSSLPDSFGSITVGGSLGLYNNQLSSLPDSFGSITVGANLVLDHNRLQDQDIPTAFPNVSGTVSK